MTDKNRLQLDWKLEWSDERANFITKYLESITWTPNEDELEMMGKYILWGKDRETGLNGRQSGLDLETRAGTWDSKEIESLESLMETPGFNEATILPKGHVPRKIIKETFSRTAARKAASPALLEDLEALWRLIDKTELLTSFYDLRSGKRTTPIRQILLNRFTDTEREEIAAAASKLSTYQYLKERHNLVEMRRQQYMLRDSYAPIVVSQSEPFFEQSMPLVFGEDIPVLPLGIAFQSLDKKLFNPDRFPIPEDFSEEELAQISKRLWTPIPPNQLVFDFSNPDHLYALFNSWNELCASANVLGDSYNDTTNVREFLMVARSYKQLAKLDPMHEEILELKIQHRTNQEIAEIINEKYGKSYKINYISTLYCKKCLEMIAAAAKDHREVVENLFFPENFKKCKDCGSILLMNEKNFVKRHRSNDGFSPRCKRCEKLLRERRK